MRIAWFTPFPPEKSAIAEYSVIIVAELQRTCDVDVWVPLTEVEDRSIAEDRYGKQFRLVRFTEDPYLLTSLSTYDAIVYNMGNNLKFHKEIFEVSLRHPGLVILHDFVLHHFFAAYYLAWKQSRDGYIAEMERNYGINGKSIAVDALSGNARNVWETDDVIKYPLNRSVCENALGVVVHSDFARSMLDSTCDCLTQKIDFPRPPQLLPPSHGPTVRERLNISPDHVILLTFGEIVPNKRVDKVIEILAGDGDLSRRIRYILIGREYEGQYDMRRLIQKNGLQDAVTILGYQPKEFLSECILASDICINLRFPTMGESSWSLAQVLLAGKPTLVTRTGWYDELPDDCVVKINPDREENDLLYNLRRLCDNRSERLEIGHLAKEYAVHHFSTEQYCTALINFVAASQQNRTIANLVDSASQELYSMGVGEGSQVVDDLSGIIYEIVRPCGKSKKGHVS